MLSRIIGDDSDAMSLFYDRYCSVVYALARTILGEGAAAERVTEETFWCVWQSRASFKPGRGSAAYWLCSIARNLSLAELDRHCCYLDEPSVVQPGCCSRQIQQTVTSNRSEVSRF